jgi:hypothetical protein
MTQKKYFTYLIITISLFLFYHLFIWTFFTSKIFALDSKHSIGDLARMSYQTDMLYKRELKYKLKRSFIYKEIYKKDESVDIITIGDSFSHGAAGGVNPYYQDYLATLYNLKVLNINPDDPYDYFATVMGLYKSGFLEKSKVHYIILQSVERFFPKRFSRDFTPQHYNPLKAVISKKTFSIRHLDVPIISTANYKYPYYTLMYHFKENAKKDIYKFTLTQNLFSRNSKNKILIFHDDIRNIPQFTQESVQKLNENFNKLSKILQKLNIKLIVLPAPDKYDIYAKYIKNNKHPLNPFFSYIRPLKKEYIFIDTKKILCRELNKGTLDLYYPDDTHWNYKASQAISNAAIFKELFGK